MSQAQAPLNCIVDDSALVASVKNNSPCSIKPWLAQGAINVFVPLYALDRLSQLRRIRCPVSGDAGKALQWLDQITNSTENKAAGRVQLQGPDDQYQTWQEVEKFLLPDTPLTTNDAAPGIDALSKMLGHGLAVNGQVSTMDPSKQSPSVSPVSTSSSLSTAGGPITAQDECSSTLIEHGIAPQARPLLNFTVWRTHNEDALFATPGKFILVTNDPIIQKQASKFGVRAKMLSQLQNILGKNPNPALGLDGAYSPKENEAAQFPGREASDDEDEVVFDPSQRPGSSRGPKLDANVLDPDHFGRSPKPTARTVNSPRRGNAEPFRALNHSPRGRGGNSMRANGHTAMGQPTGRGLNGPAAPRGNGFARGRGGNSLGRGQKQVYPRPIDPDSYARPSPMGRRGRGGYSRLWEPTSSG